MKVQLLPHTGANVATGKLQQLPQYRVVVDDELVGYKSWKHGSAICFIGRVSPLDQKQIEQEVMDLVGDNAGSVQPPEYDPSTVELEEEQYDDFNEEVSS